jgi:hypothetical protein
MSTPLRYPCTARRAGSGDELVLRLELSLGPHPMVELTAARLMMVALEELARDHVPVARLKLALQGRLVASPRR